MYYLGWKHHALDHCLFVKWKENKLIAFLLWVDDCLVAGPEHLVKEEVEKFSKLFEVIDEGNMHEYVGCKIERTKEYIKMTQPIKV